MRQAGRYLPEYREVRATCRDFLDLCYSPDKAVEVTLQPLRRYGFDAAILFADILLVPDALGCEVAFKEGEGPRLRPVRDKAAVAGLKQGDVLGHLAPVMETVTRLSKAIPERTTLIGFAGAPWTVATYMVEGRGSKDFVETKKMAYGDRAAFSQLIERLVEVTAAYLVAQVKAGAEVLQLFDTWAGVLPEAEFKDWVVGPTQRIVEKVAACCPGVPTIGFPKGAGAMLSGYAEKTGVTGVGLDTSVPLDWAVKAMGGKVTLQGNLDPVLLVAGGDALDRGVDRILHQTAGVPFIFNLGHGILPETRPENVARLVERVRRWRG